MNLGLIGKSLSHSFSKSYIEEKFIHQDKLNFKYTNYDLDNLDSLHQLIISEHLSGLNNTKP